MEEPVMPFAEQLERALSGAGVGDTKNNFVGVLMQLEVPTFWPRIKTVQTFEEYVRGVRYTELAEASIKGTNPDFIATYNRMAEAINKEIGTGVSNQEQANRIEVLIKEVLAFIKAQH